MTFVLDASITLAWCFVDESSGMADRVLGQLEGEEARSTLPVSPTERMTDPSTIRLEFDGDIWYWRGPSPYRFVSVPEEACVALRAVAAEVTYGWGMIPVTGRIGGTVFETSLFPKDGRYVVPIKDVVRKAEGVAEGDIVTVEFTIRS